MTIVTIDPILQEKLTPEGVRAFINILNEVEENAKDRSIAEAENKFEKRLSDELSKINETIYQTKSELRTEIAQLDAKIAQTASELEAKISQSASELRTEIAQLDAKIDKTAANLGAKIADTKVTIIKWMVTLLFAQTALLVGIFSILFK